MTHSVQAAVGQAVYCFPKHGGSCDRQLKRQHPSPHPVKVAANTACWTGPSLVHDTTHSSHIPYAHCNCGFCSVLFCVQPRFSTYTPSVSVSKRKCTSTTQPPTLPFLRSSASSWLCARFLLSARPLLTTIQLLTICAAVRVAACLKGRTTELQQMRSYKAQARRQQ